MSGEVILVVDDDKEIRNLIKIYLENENYKIIQAENGIEAVNALKHEKVDFIILDVMMPKMDGMEACIKIREISDVPILMLSAKSEDMDKILGLTTGADDYVTKPFNPLELIARVKSQLRRYNGIKFRKPLDKDVIEINDITINKKTHDVKKGEEDIKLTPTEFDILFLLASNKGMVFSMDNIYETVWGEDSCCCNNVVMVHIRKLREKIEDNPNKPLIIKTIWGVGYKIEK